MHRMIPTPAIGTPPGIRLYKVEDDFVVADDAGWVPGVYSTVEAAIAAAI